MLTASGWDTGQPDSTDLVSFGRGTDFWFGDVDKLIDLLTALVSIRGIC